MERISFEESPPIYLWDIYRELVVNDSTLERAIRARLDEAKRSMEEAKRSPTVTECGLKALERALQSQIEDFLEPFLKHGVIWFPEPSFATVTQLHLSDCPEDITGEKSADTPCDLMPDAV